ENYAASRRCSLCEHQSTRRIVSRSTGCAVAGKDFRCARCSIPRVLLTRRHQSHPCSVLFPVSMPLLLRASPLLAPNGADAEIPGRVDRQTEWSSFFDGTLLVATSPASLLRRCFGVARLMRAGSRCIAKELSPAELRAKRLTEAATSPWA